MPDVDQQDRKTAFSNLFNEHLAGEDPPAPSAPGPAPTLQQAAAAAVVAPPALPPAPAPVQRQRRSRGEGESNDRQAERKFTLYLEPDLKKALIELCDGAFFDSRGAVEKSDVHNEIVRRALADAGAIVAELNRRAAQ